MADNTKLNIDDYAKIMQDTDNHAIEIDKYLAQISDEKDPNKRFSTLKRFFTERITRELYQNMDLIHSISTTPEQFKKIYLTIAKSIFLNLIVAVDVLSVEKTTDVNKDSRNISIDDLFKTSQYTICEAYCQAKN